MSKKIQTVLGCIDPAEAGVTLAHEHLHLSFDVAYSPHPHPSIRKYKDEVLAMDCMWWINQHPYSSVHNLRMREEQEAIIEEMHFFKENGGGTICDVTTIGINRNLEFLQKVTKTTGVHVVAGSGYYVEASRPETVDQTVEEMAKVMTADLTTGCEGTNIKCGCIGEVGCSWPLAETEKRAVQASGVVNEALKCPVIIHPGRSNDAPAEIVRYYQEAGGRMDQLIMSHLDRTITDVGELLEFAKLGCYCEYDLFGIETSHYQMDVSTDMPSDAQRVQRVKALVDEGYEDKVTIAHDIHTKHRLMKYGGHGFSHILLNIMPKMLSRGISQEAVTKMVVQNPQRWLAFSPPQ